MKSVKKTLSGVVALAIMSAMFVMSVKADTAVIVFGNSSFTWNHSSVGSSANAYDGTYTIFNGGGATITATRTFSIENADEYTLEVYAASSITNINLSNLQFQIDGGSTTTLNSSNSTVTALTNPCRSDDPWTTKDIKYNTNILLDKGIHTIIFTVPQNSNGRTAAYFAFDCAVLKATNNLLRIDGEENTTIGNSSFSWSHNEKQNNEHAYDGTYSISTWNGAKRTANVTFYVEKTGTYTFDVNATLDLNNHDFSTLKFSIDSGEVVTLTTSNATQSELDVPWSNALGWVRNYAYKNEFLLEEGIHTLNFEFPQRSIDTIAPYAFDCATIKPTNNLMTVYGNAATTIGNSKFTWSNPNDKQNNANAYDGTYSTTNWGGVIRTANITFYVEETGSYKFDVNGVTNMTLDGASPMKFGIDDGAMITLSNSNVTVSALASPWATKDGWTVKNVAYNNALVLEEGLHTLNFEFPIRSSGDVTIYAFDRARFTPVVAENQLFGRLSYDAGVVTASMVNTYSENKTVYLIYAEYLTRGLSEELIYTRINPVVVTAGTVYEDTEWDISGYQTGTAGAHGALYLWDSLTGNIKALSSKLSVF